MDTLSKDVRYGFRSLLKRPASAVIAVITPALEIGAHTAFFSTINALLLKPLPFSDPDRIVPWTSDSQISDLKLERSEN
jgi:hypothetical protein